MVTRRGRASHADSREARYVRASRLEAVCDDSEQRSARTREGLMQALRHVTTVAAYRLALRSCPGELPPAAARPPAAQAPPGRADARGGARRLRGAVLDRDSTER